MSNTEQDVYPYESLLTNIFSLKQKFDPSPYIPSLIQQLPQSNNNIVKIILDIFYALAVTNPKSLVKWHLQIKEKLNQIQDMKESVQLVKEVMLNIEDESQLTRRIDKVSNNDVSYITDFTSQYLGDQILNPNDISIVSQQKNQDFEIFNKFQTIVEVNNQNSTKTL